MLPLIFIPGEPERFYRYRAAIAAAGGETRLSLSAEDVQGCAGLLLPGGGDPDPALYGEAPAGSQPPDAERDALELAVIETFMAQKKPIFGVCRGIQICNVWFGGTLFQDIPNHGQHEDLDQYHWVRSAPGSVPEELFGPRALVNTAHHQAVHRLGDGLHAVQWAEDGTVEAVWHETLPVFGVQWHPERLRGENRPAESVDGDRLFSYFLSLCR